MAIIEQRSVVLMCDGEACKRCKGKCTATYPATGSVSISGIFKTKRGVVSHLRIRAYGMDWERIGGLDLCPDCARRT
jgi:hypothetical protein